LRGIPEIKEALLNGIRRSIIKYYRNHVKLICDAFGVSLIDREKEFRDTISGVDVGSENIEEATTPADIMIRHLEAHLVAHIQKCADLLKTKFPARPFLVYDIHPQYKNTDTTSDEKPLAPKEILEKLCRTLQEKNPRSQYLRVFQERPRKLETQLLNLIPDYPLNLTQQAEKVLGRLRGVANRVHYEERKPKDAVMISVADNKYSVDWKPIRRALAEGTKFPAPVADPKYNFVTNFVVDGLKEPNS
jgi:hypothetical protein